MQDDGPYNFFYDKNSFVKNYTKILYSLNKK